MLYAQWIKSAQSAGWLVAGVTGLTISIRCSKQGCAGVVTVPLTNLGRAPDRCQMPHHGQYSSTVFQQYVDLVAELVRRRRSLGLSQEDICAASGLADGHVNKLEAFDRTAQFPTLQLWAQTLGLSITLAPCALPSATINTIERRPAPLREIKRQKVLKLNGI